MTDKPGATPPPAGVPPRPPVKCTACGGTGKKS